MSNKKQFYRVKLLIGIKSYSEGTSPESAIKNLAEKIMNIPEIEEQVHIYRIVKSKAEHPMSVEEMLADDPDKW